MADKTALLAESSARLGRHNAVSHTSAGRFSPYPKTPPGRPQRDPDYPTPGAPQCQLEALALSDSGFETMRTLAPPVGRAWEFLAGPASNGNWDWEAELAELPELLAEKLASPSVEADRYDLVVDPSNLWLTIHESIGHATELDRAVGYEAAYADLVRHLRQGRQAGLRLPVMHGTGDRTVDHGLATVAIDDEGVDGQSFDLMRDGILVGYQLDRGIAAAIGYQRSNGAPRRLPDPRADSTDRQRLAGPRRPERPEHG